MRVLRMLLVLFVSGCLEAETVKACGEACKERGGVSSVDGCQCICKNSR